MPEVPYKPFPQVAPQDIATPRISVDMPRIHFSEAIGSALGQLGEGKQVLGHATTQVGAALATLGDSFEHAGNEIFQRAVAIKHLENETAATEADAQYMQRSALQSEAFQAQTGNAASQGLDAHMKGLDDLRQQIRTSLPNDDARRMYDHSSLQTMGRATWYAARHAVQQGKAASVGAFKSKFSLDLNSLENRSAEMSPEQFETEKQQLKDYYTQKIAPLLGERGSQLELAMQENESKINAARVAGVGKSDPVRGLALLDDYRKKNQILAGTAIQLENQLRDKDATVAAGFESDRTMDEVRKARANDPEQKEKPLNDLIDDTIKRLPERFQDDSPTARHARELVTEQVTRKWNVDQASVRNQRFNDVEYIVGQLYDKDGNIRDSVDKLKAAAPDIEAKYNSLPLHGSQSQKTIRDAINTAVRAEHNIDPTISNETLNHIQGLAVENKDELMSMNMWDPKLKMNIPERKAAIAFRKKFMANPDGDLRTSRAWGWLEQGRRDELDSLGLLNAKKDDPNKIAALGWLTSALQAWEDTHKHAVATYKDVNEVIGPQLLKHTIRTWNPATWFGGEHPMYESKYTEKWADDVRKVIESAGGSPPTEHDLTTAWRREQWMKLFQGKTKAPAAPAPKPAAAVEAPE